MGDRGIRPRPAIEPKRERSRFAAARPARTGKGGAMIEQFFRSYLIAYLFWFGIAVGCLPLLMLPHLVGGAWGFVIRRSLEAGTRTLPLMVALFVPILFGMNSLYE